MGDEGLPIKFVDVLAARKSLNKAIQLSIQAISNLISIIRLCGHDLGAMLPALITIIIALEGITVRGDTRRWLMLC